MSSKSQPASRFELDGAYRDRLIDTLCELIAIPSCSHKDGGDEGRIQAYVAGRMRSAGARVRCVEAVDIPGFFEHPLCFGPDRDYHNRPLVLGEIGPVDAPAMLVLAHSDTVSVNNDPAQWSVTAPFQPLVRDGKVYGRGSGDDKWGLAAVLTTLEALVETGVTPSRRLIFASTVDEENGVGNGLLMLHLAGVRAEAALYLDGMASRIAIGNLGGSNLLLRPNRSIPDSTIHTHARALEDLCRTLSAEREHLFTGPFAQHPIRHRSVLSRVDREGDALRLVVSFYTVPGEDGRGLLRDLKRRVSQFLDPGEDLYTVTCRQPWFEPTVLPTDHPWVDLVSWAYRESIGDDPVVTTSSKQDSFVLRKHGVPTVSFGVSCGRGPGALHEPDEYIDIDEAWLGLRFAYRTVCAWMDAEEP